MRIWSAGILPASSEQVGEQERARCPRYAVFLLLMVLPVFAWSKPLLPDFSDIAYGPDPRNKFALWLANSSKKTALVIYYHGGDKYKEIHARFLNKLLSCGISVAAAEYRFLSASVHYPAPQEDAVRLLQFIRLHAEEYNVDAARVALAGSSAGGNMALWIALQDDMADPKNADPIKRQSTRVACVLAYDAQTTDDPYWYIKHVAAFPGIYQRSATYYGVSPEEIRSPSSELKQIFDHASPATYVSKDDPPVFLVYKGRMTDVPLPPDTNPQIIIHHPVLGVLLDGLMTSVGVESHVYWADGGTKDRPMPPSADYDFLCEKLSQP